MEFDIARRMMIELKKSDGWLNALAAIVEEIEDDSERMDMRRRVANVMGEIYGEVWRPIEMEHPSLNEE